MVRLQFRAHCSQPLTQIVTFMQENVIMVITWAWMNAVFDTFTKI